MCFDSVTLCLVLDSVRREPSSPCLCSHDAPCIVVSQTKANALCTLLSILQSELGESANTKRPTSCVLINTEKPWEGRSKADDIIEEAKKLLPQL